jgi:hypothetical protein
MIAQRLGLHSTCLDILAAVQELRSRGAAAADVETFGALRPLDESVAQALVFKD